MKITEVKNCPPGLNYFDKDDLESKLEPQDIEDIVEIFQTPPPTSSFTPARSAAIASLSSGSLWLARMRMATIAKSVSLVISWVPGSRKTWSM